MSGTRLSDRSPKLGADELIATLVPPPRFDAVRFTTYIPDSEEPSQALAVGKCSDFAHRISRSAGKKGGSWWSSLMNSSLLSNNDTTNDSAPMGLYLDGGFGVGKTHLLASIWHAAPSPKAYGTFVELTHLVGALGFLEAVRRLSEHRLLAIDEFELDDPGDTTLITRLLGELMNAGVYVATTSNTLPDKLGEGRFAAADFLREIQTLSRRFSVVRVDGQDYRHRGLPEAPPPMSEEDLTASAAAHEGSTVDDFDVLCAHLATLHPSRYGKLVEGVSMAHFRQLHPVGDQSVALRFVALVDRLYDRAIPIGISGQPLAALFTEEMLQGGYRKKYLRALSRLTALTRDAAKVSQCGA